MAQVVFTMAPCRTYTGTICFHPTAQRMSRKAAACAPQVAAQGLHAPTHATVNNKALSIHPSPAPAPMAIPIARPPGTIARLVMRPACPT